MNEPTQEKFNIDPFMKRHFELCKEKSKPNHGIAPKNDFQKDVDVPLTPAEYLDLVDSLKPEDFGDFVPNKSFHGIPITIMSRKYFKSA